MKYVTVIANGGTKSPKAASSRSRLTRQRESGVKPVKPPHSKVRFSSIVPFGRRQRRVVVGIAFHLLRANRTLPVLELLIERSGLFGR